jgi:hypothetical protein
VVGVIVEVDGVEGGREGGREAAEEEAAVRALLGGDLFDFFRDDMEGKRRGIPDGVGDRVKEMGEKGDGGKERGREGGRARGEGGRARRKVEGRR